MHIYSNQSAKPFSKKFAVSTSETRESGFTISVKYLYEEEKVGTVAFFYLSEKEALKFANTIQNELANRILMEN